MVAATMKKQQTPLGQRNLTVIAAVYFLLCLAHSIWRSTLQNHATENLGLSGQDIGLLYSLTYIPGAIAFTFGMAANRYPLHNLLYAAFVLVAVGLMVSGVAGGFYSLALGALLLTLGFTGFYTLANAVYLIASPAEHCVTALGSLKSMGPLAGLVAGLTILMIFAPFQFSDIVQVAANEDSGYLTLSLIELFSAKPKVEPAVVELLLLGLGATLLLISPIILARMRRARVEISNGHLILRSSLIPFYLLNFIAGCRSAIFQAFAIRVMVKQFNLPIHSTATIILVGYFLSFLGYRAIARALNSLCHRTVIRVIYLTVAANFLGFWYITGLSNLSTSTAFIALGGLFFVDSFFFGASVVTDSHLRLTGSAAEYPGDVSTGTTLFYIAAMSMSFVAAYLWGPLGRHTFLIGTGVCLSAIVVCQYLVMHDKQTHPEI